MCSRVYTLGGELVKMMRVEVCVCVCVGSSFSGSSPDAGEVLGVDDTSSCILSEQEETTPGGDDLI